MNNFWNGRKVLVTGAGGFTGSNLCNRLAEHQADVTAFLRKGGSERKLHENVKIITGDLTNPEDCIRTMKDMDTVFNVAAIFRNVKGSEQQLRDIHVHATENLIRAAKQEGARRFIHTSTMGVHGHVKNGPGNEETEFSPGDAYQETKVEGELLAFKLSKEINLDLTVIRPCGIYGPGDTRFLKLVKPIKNRQFFMIGSGETHYHFVYIDDLVNGYMLAGEKPGAVGEAFLIGGSDAPTLNELARKIAEIQKVPAPKFKIPVWPIYYAGWACEIIFGLFNIEPILHRRRVAFFTKNRDFTISKAQNLLGYEPEVGLEQGLTSLIRWYESEGLV